MRSFVEVEADSQFPIQNLPFGVCRRRDRPAPRVCVAIGELALDLAEIEDAGALPDGLVPTGALQAPNLNPLMAAGRPAWRRLRAELTRLLDADEPRLRDDAELRPRALVPRATLEMLLPAAIGDYTDFYSSREHATNVGTMFRGAEAALMPNWLHLPVAYHGRASSVVVSGTDVRRPWGQVLPEGAERPLFRPSAALDFELEMGFFVGPPSALGEPVGLEVAEENIFGLVLVNDWSARDIQKWEYQPLGPFLAKNFATTISPWVVTLEALEPFRVPAVAQDPEPLEYLRQPEERRTTFDIHLEVSLQPGDAARPTTLCRTNFRHLYWTMAQQLAHHTVTGCDLRPGDLMASGTISGPGPGARGSLLELSWGGRTPFELDGGDSRSFLLDGDEVTMTAFCQGEGFRVGFGEATGRITAGRES